MIEKETELLQQEKTRFKNELEKLGQKVEFDEPPRDSGYRCSLKCGDFKIWFCIGSAYSDNFYRSVVEALLFSGKDDRIDDQIFRCAVRSKVILNWLKRHFSGKADKEFAELESRLSAGATLLWEDAERKIYHVKDTDATVLLQPMRRPPIQIRNLKGQLAASTTPLGFDGALKRAFINKRIHSKGL